MITSKYSLQIVRVTASQTLIKTLTFNCKRVKTRLKTWEEIALCVQMEEQLYNIRCQ